MKLLYPKMKVRNHSVVNQSCINICWWNARSLVNKLHDFSSFVDTHTHMHGHTHTCVCMEQSTSHICISHRPSSKEAKCITWEDARSDDRSSWWICSCVVIWWHNNLFIRECSQIPWPVSGMCVHVSSVVCTYMYRLFNFCS